VFGTFIAFVFLTPFVGGLLADMKLGYRFSITLGGILMGIGYLPGETSEDGVVNRKGMKERPKWMY